MMFTRALLIFESDTVEKRISLRILKIPQTERHHQVAGRNERERKKELSSSVILKAVVTFVLVR